MAFKFLSPEVQTQEIDLSEIIPTLLSSIGAIVTEGSKGSTERTLYQNNQQWIADHGNPTKPSHFAALKFLEQRTKK